MKTKEEIRAYHAAWYAANKQKVLDYNAVWVRAHPEQAKAQKEAWRRAHPPAPGAHAKQVAEWRRAHPEQYKKATAEWRSANGGKVRAYTAKWRKAHPEQAKAGWAATRAKRSAQMKAYRAEYYAAHKDELNAKAKAKRLANPEFYKAKASAWGKTHLAAGLARTQKREARKLAAFVEDVDRLVVFERDKWLCGVCHKKVKPAEASLDHIIPLARGGEHSYRQHPVSPPAVQLWEGCSCCWSANEVTVTPEERAAIRRDHEQRSSWACSCAWSTPCVVVQLLDHIDQLEADWHRIKRVRPNHQRQSRGQLPHMGRAPSPNPNS